jgi:ParB family chromosome partitioning protein
MERLPRLGRGLAALLSETTADAVNGDFSKGSLRVPIELIHSSQRNPRKLFDPAEIEALSFSIKQRGLLQPLLVRSLPSTPDHYELIAGERRWRAAQAAQLHVVPVILLDVTESEALEIALIENIQRTNLNPLEEAHGYRTLTIEFNYSQDEIGKLVGKSRSHIANTLRLLNLPDHTKSLLERGVLTAGHARALITYPDPDKMADEIISKEMTVREVERLTNNRDVKIHRQRKNAYNHDPDTRLWETKFTEALGTSVRLYLASNKGELRITIQSPDQLEAIYNRIVGPE